ncbi:aminoacyl-tRNA hydrolase, partial [Bacillus atrophaeus]|nr:aminoacyl-tRNA hydrolase [Bacillus atrophaeus]
QHLGTSDFNRIRIGIGRPVNGMKIKDYVLGAFTSEEEPAVQEAVRKSVNACEASLDKPFLEVMNEFNAKV